ncbi:MAG TPA: SAM-dependent chlorinase/fluorinase [Candidatus Sumerlaeota bacterium]|nr:MAG: Adenosyl-chloride synthase [candidate division BRC1 bacterium ADurb.BinA292]HOE95604.1 SAM-dependent chlorinase/fluorinase [Candidatus Sumerlaeota bacterium]HOR29135.1 SAM-dependent chlorinase/fluorinase [Candidatus Sumerlaeota bacterium]HPK03723.1 SAM-dependent chlorinase/fluorinase [Candidatus Sumerlaeota bacterium]
MPAAPPATPIVALLTDFGVGDWYVGAMKGEILRRAPHAHLVDVTHGLPPHQVLPGAFVLHCAAGSFPAGTIFCCVVDPGVGTERRALCGRVGPWLFSGPDNGLLSGLLEGLAPDDLDLHRIENPEFRNERVSSTFHGRDLFAPAAARLALGFDPAQAGPPVADPLRLPLFELAEQADRLTGRVVLIDQFGNLVTNIRRRSHGAWFEPGRFVIHAGALRLDTLSTTFGEVRHVQALAYWGSAGTLEIAVNQGSAAGLTGLRLGDAIDVERR